jgi:hypothetical protein
LARSQKTTNGAHFGDVEAAAFAVLGELVENPLIHPHEPEIVAALRTRIGEGLKPRHVGAQLATSKSKKGLVAERPRLRLPRVLSEVSLEGLDGAAGKSGQRHPLRFDLGVLHEDAAPVLQLHGAGVIDVKLRLDPTHLASVLEVKSAAGLYTDLVAGHRVPRWGPRDLLKLLHAASTLDRGFAGMVFVDRVLRYGELAKLPASKPSADPRFAAPSTTETKFVLGSRSGPEAPWPLTHRNFTWKLPEGLDPTGQGHGVTLKFKAVSPGQPPPQGSVALWALAVTAKRARIASGDPAEVASCRWNVSLQARL